MTKINKIIVISITAWLSFTAIADGHEEAPTYLPLEGFACNYNSGKDLGDFIKATEKWNDYVDETGVSYNAWVFTPYFYSEDQKADAYWIGIAPTWEELMKGAETMANSKGQKIQAEFDKITTCYDHSNWGLEIVRSSAELGDAVVTMQWCTLTEEATPEKLVAADKKLNAFLDSGDSTGGISRWYPGSGVPSRFDADLLWVQSAESMVAWGKGADQAVNGGGNQVSQELYGDLMTCNNREVFIADAVRAVSVQ